MNRLIVPGFAIWKAERQRPTLFFPADSSSSGSSQSCLIPHGNFTFFECRLTAFFVLTGNTGLWIQKDADFVIYLHRISQANAWISCRLPDSGQRLKRAMTHNRQFFRICSLHEPGNDREQRMKPSWKPGISGKRLITSSQKENQKPKDLFLARLFSDRLEDLKSIRQPSILSLLFTPPLLPENKVRFGVCIQRLDSLFFCWWQPFGWRHFRGVPVASKNKSSNKAKAGCLWQRNKQAWVWTKSLQTSFRLRT